MLAQVDGGYSHEFTTAQVHNFLAAEYGEDYSLPNPPKFAVFEDHLLYATGVARFAKFEDKIQTLRDLQVAFQQHTGVRDYSAVNGVSPGICHQVAREEFKNQQYLSFASDEARVGFLGRHNVFFVRADSRACWAPPTVVWNNE